VIENASRVGRYETLSDADLFDMEYWVARAGEGGKIRGEKFSAAAIVWISGAASGIGLATAAAFERLARMYFDGHQRQKVGGRRGISPFKKTGGLFVCDATKPNQVQASLMPARKPSAAWTL